MRFLKKIEDKIKRLAELEAALQDPKVAQDPARLKDLGKEFRDLERVAAAYKDYLKIEEGIEGAQKILAEKEAGAEWAAMANEELQRLESRKKDAVRHLEGLVAAEDPMLSKNVILEIRAGTGGLEAGLFAADLFRMYSRFAAASSFKVEILSSSPNEAGGFKEIIASIAGSGAYGRFKYESGTHRVQRVPATEAQGRIHTSAVTVAVLPEAGEVDIEVKPEELRIDTFCSSGPGGQSVNTTYSAIRITHLPTGLIVTCQDEKSQMKNKQKALKVLRSRLLERKMREEEEKRAKQRKEQVGTGDRSEKIRTYNFPDHRVTDHRIGLTVHNLQAVLEGELDAFVDALYEEELAKS
ncbi:MAG: peptide chain release factor 1 [Candidatus Omnitrophica bacterium]|nr:peptide chain release factor 1 [Candidatus Omnitrophota bacterium]